MQLLQKQTDLDELLALREWKDKEDPEDFIVSWATTRKKNKTLRFPQTRKVSHTKALLPFQVRLENAEIETEKSLNDIIKKLESELRRAKLRETGEEDIVVTFKPRTL